VELVGISRPGRHVTVRWCRNRLSCPVDQCSSDDPWRLPRLLADRVGVEPGNRVVDSFDLADFLLDFLGGSLDLVPDDGELLTRYVGGRRLVAGVERPESVRSGYRVVEPNIFVFL